MSLACSVAQAFSVIRHLSPSLTYLGSMQLEMDCWNDTVVVWMFYRIATYVVDYAVWPEIVYYPYYNHYFEGGWVVH